MPVSPIDSLIALIERSKDIGDGWRECSDICWQLVQENYAEEDLFDLDHERQRVRIKPKPSIDDLANQIEQWREKTITELRMHDRKLAAKIFD